MPRWMARNTPRSTSPRRRRVPPRHLAAPSKAFADSINGGSPASLSLLALSQGAASEGGFPIVVDGKLIGAIGASGGIATQDGMTAKAGLDAVTSH